MLAAFLARSRSGPEAYLDDHFGNPSVTSRRHFVAAKSPADSSSQPEAPSSCSERRLAEPLIFPPTSTAYASLSGILEYNYLVRVKNSITIPKELLGRLDRVDKNRSALLERAARAYLAQLERQARDRKDIEIIDRDAERFPVLNRRLCARVFKVRRLEHPGPEKGIEHSLR